MMMTSDDVMDRQVARDLSDHVVVPDLLLHCRRRRHGHTGADASGAPPARSASSSTRVTSTLQCDCWRSCFREQPDPAGSVTNEQINLKWLGIVQSRDCCFDSWSVRYQRQIDNLTIIIIHQSQLNDWSFWTCNKPTNKSATPSGESGTWE